MRHPVLTNKVRLIIWWLVWLFLMLGQSLLFYYAYGYFTYINVIDFFVSLVVSAGLALSLWYPFSFINSSENKIVTVISNLLLIGIILIILWVLITKYIILLFLPNESAYLIFWDTTFPYRIGTGAFIYSMIVLSYYLFINATNLAEKRTREVRLESLVKETELKMLRSQINPHFLFNSLNSISSLTITDPEKARTMVVKLSEFMRYSLSRKDELPVTLRSELDNLRLYLDIEKVRFGDKLSTTEEISDDSLEVRVPAMLLQPLYENAIKHGVYESTESVKLTTAASIKGDFLELIISNNYDESYSAKRGTGTGLLNVKRRLELSYGNRASVRTVRENGIFTATLYIPLKDSNPRILSQNEKDKNNYN
jgi:two-component system, LytTR family, sensor kinase